MKPLAAFDVEQAELTGITLIEASAGTGKTHTIATLFLRLLLERELEVSEILVVTYTRAATAELRLRIRKRLHEALQVLAEPTPGAVATGDLLSDPILMRLAQSSSDHAQAARQRARLVEALRAFDEAPIFTIHGFAQRVLKRHAFESQVAFDAELSEDQGLLIEEIVCDYYARHVHAASEHFLAALDARQLTVESLVQLVRRVLTRPELEIVPALSAWPEVTALERAFEQARERVGQLWAAGAGELQQILTRKGMNKNSYSQARVFKRWPSAFARAGSLNAALLPDGIEALTPAGMKVNKGNLPPEHVFFEACAELVASAKALCASLEAQLVAFQRGLLDYALQQLAERSAAKNNLSFDDLVARLAEALRGDGAERLIAAVRGSYKAALIDEFQDTDPAQCEVFQRIYAAPSLAHGPGTLFLIGDPKQAIYGFRGADVFAYLAAARSGVDRAYTLGTNWRSDPGLLVGINALFDTRSPPFVFDEIAYRPVQAAPIARDQLSGTADTAPLQIGWLPREPGQKALGRQQAELQLYAAVPEAIACLLASDLRIDGKPIEPRQIAILCRKNAQARELQGRLRELGIPSVLDGDASVFESNMAEELARWLWAMAEPADPVRVRAALASVGLGVTAQGLLELDQAEQAWDHWVSSFQRLNQVWHTRGFMQALHALCDEHEIPPRLFQLGDGERRYTDLMHLAELLHTHALQTRKGPRALLEWYGRMRSGDAERGSLAREDVQIRLESDARAVMLTTIHRSKGLEFPIVYCPFVWDGTLLFRAEKNAPLFHDPAHAERLTLELPPVLEDAPSVAMAEREALAENLRLLYVAVTRAKHRLTLFCATAQDFDKSAFAYLLKAPRSQAEGEASVLSVPKPNLDDPALEAELARLASCAAGAISVHRLVPSTAPVPHYTQPRADSAALAARTAAVPVAEALRISSFSQLSASGRAPHDSEPIDRDDDELPAHAPNLLPPMAAELPSSAATTSGPVALAGLPAGAGFGHLIHSIYETSDWQAPEAHALAANVSAVLGSYAAEPTWEPVLSAAVFDSLHTPLTAAGGGLQSLAHVSSAQRRCELEFLCPVSGDRGEDRGHALLAPARLGRVLADHARDAFELSYAKRLAGLGFAPFAGFLRGFIDAVVEHAGRYYVLDYKSNLLGPQPEDYRRERLASVMRRHHYVLQYLIYSVAVDRYLRLRLRDYSYAQHFGGVYYLFVRGMGRAHPPGSGVYFDRPEPALINALSASLFDPEVSHV